MSLYVPERIGRMELNQARTIPQVGGMGSFGGGGGGGGYQSYANAAWQDALRFSAQTAANQAAQRAAQQKAYDDYWAGKGKTTASSSGTGTLSAANPFGGFINFGGTGIY